MCFIYWRTDIDEREKSKQSFVKGNTDILIVQEQLNWR